MLSEQSTDIILYFIPGNSLNMESLSFLPLIALPAFSLILSDLWFNWEVTLEERHFSCISSTK